jgi:hypothetical protein
MQSKKTPVVSIIFYVLAGILFAYSIWAFVFSLDYVSTAVAQNQLIIEGYEFEIASFYMTNVAQYVVFAAILFGIGWILQKIGGVEADLFEIDYDEDLIEDEWLDKDEEEVVEPIIEDVPEE